MFPRHLPMLMIAISAWSYCECAIAVHQEETAEWTIRADNSATAKRATIDRLTGSAPAASATSSEIFSLIWPEALLEADGRVPPSVRLELLLSVGHTMSVGEHTPYPGLITKIDDARGRIVNLATGQVFMLRMSERGNWGGFFIHADSHGTDHLAVEFPFSLYDEKSSELVAQSKLLGRFDLSNRDRPRIPVLRFSPTEFRELRQQTADLGNAIENRAAGLITSAKTDREQYRAHIEESKVWGIAGREQFSDLFATESLALYGCGSNQLMHLELHAAALERSGPWRSPSFSLDLSYAPDLIDPENRIAYLSPLRGQLVFQGEDGSRVVEIGPGNHGLVASKAFQKDNNLRLHLGVTLRDDLDQPAVAQLTVDCSATEASCSVLTLETAVDPDGRVMSQRSLSSIVERRDRTEPSNGRIHRIAIAEPLGGSPGCPGLCPTCKTDGCSVGDGACWDAGAPIGCTVGCTHYPNTVQCCMSGYPTKRCCVNKCATPP
jgi:hypothetical protein